jgi:DNA-binding NarL/FixJ family response regulator
MLNLVYKPLPEDQQSKDSALLVYRSIGISRLTTYTMRAFRNVGVRTVNIREEDDLILFLNDKSNDITYLAVDIEECLNLKGANPYDYLRMLSTILSINGNSSSIVIVVSLDTDIARIKEFMNIPEVKGMFLRCGESTDEEFAEAITDIKNGKFHVPARIKERLKKTRKPRTNKNKDEITLTPRQKQIVELVVTKGASNKVIANILKISESTVKLHITAILKKYGLRNRTQLALFAKEKN